MMAKHLEPTQAATEEPISPPLYQQTLERLTLQTICLDCVNAYCHRERFAGRETSLTLVTSAEDRQDDYYSMFMTYRLHGRHDGEITLEIEATYRLVFRASEPVPAGFFDVFRELNLRMITMPYFRELLASTTGRMELPTLTIPLDIFAADSEETAEEVTPPAEETTHSTKAASRSRKTPSSRKRSNS